jgi:hypothetical protein
LKSDNVSLKSIPDEVHKIEYKYRAILSQVVLWLLMTKSHQIELLKISSMLTDLHEVESRYVPQLCLRKRSNISGQCSGKSM